MYEAGMFICEQAVKHLKNFIPIETLTGKSSCLRVMSLTVSVCVRVPRLTTNHFLYKTEILGIFY